MQYFDYTLFAFILLFVWLGFWAGFIKAAGRLIGIFIGLIIAKFFYQSLATAWVWVFFNNQTVTEITVFILLFVVTSRICGLLFWIVDRLFNVIAFFPFFTTFNRIVGALLGLFEGVITVGIVLYILSNYPISEQLMTHINNSTVAQSLLSVVAVLKPLLPQIITQIESQL